MSSVPPIQLPAQIHHDDPPLYDPLYDSPDSDEDASAEEGDDRRNTLVANRDANALALVTTTGPTSPTGPNIQDIQPDLVIQDMFVLLDEQPGNNRWRCTGRCGAYNAGFAFVGGPARMYAHLLGLSGQGVAACTALPRSIRKDGVTYATTPIIVRAIVQGLYDAWVRRNRMLAQRRENRDQQLEPASVRRRIADGEALVPFQGQARASGQNTLALEGSKVVVARYACDEVRMAFARAFMMNGIPPSVIECPYLRKAIDMRARCPDFRFPKQNDFQLKHYEEVYEETKERADALLIQDCRIYGAASAQDGVKGTRAVPFLTWFILVPSVPLLQDVQDCTGKRKDMRFLVDETKKRMAIVNALVGQQSGSGVVDLVLADGACAGMAKILDDECPWVTMMICFFHCMDRVFADIFNPQKMPFFSDLKQDSAIIVDFMMTNEKPLALFKRFSKELTPTKDTVHLTDVERRKPKMPRKACETRAASEHYLMESDVFFEDVFRSVVQCPEWTTWVQARDREQKQKALDVRRRVLDSAKYEAKRAASVSVTSCC
jgi:hypothetical protein